MTKENRIELFDIVAAKTNMSKELCKWLKEESIFFDAPGSINHHGAYDGGLFDHSYSVMETLLMFTKSLNLKWNDDRSPYIVGLFHDFCKIDNYFYNQVDDKWEYDTKQHICGHGDKSVIMLSRFMTLTEEEIACIRWHMGAYDNKENWAYYGRAVEMFPNVLFAHTADMYSAKIVGV